MTRLFDMLPADGMTPANGDCLGTNMHGPRHPRAAQIFERIGARAAYLPIRQAFAVFRGNDAFSTAYL